MADPYVVVVGSVNVDLYLRMPESSVKLSGKTLDMVPVRGMTLPAKAFLQNPKIASQLQEAGLSYEEGKEEALVLAIEGAFDQKTGGKGANSAAACGQSLACRFLCNFGSMSEEANKSLLADLERYGNVDTSSCSTVAGPTGTAYILLFPDNDNSILLIGGANQSWPPSGSVSTNSEMRKALDGCVAVMLQREIPAYINVEVAKLAQELKKPVFMDVGGTDAPLDENLLPYLSVIAPNETELTFISGVTTQKGGQTDISLVRQAVLALKEKCLSAGNSSVEFLVTLGADGSVYFPSGWSAASDELETHVGTYTLATSSGRPIDTTGAGDCFRGSYVAARYGEKRSVAESMQWAAAAASLAVEVEGAMPSMPGRRAIAERFVQAVQEPAVKKIKL